MTENDIRQWLDSFTRTAIDKDLTGHMAHISAEVEVLGVPGFDVLGYEQWYKQCAEEFPQGVIEQLAYSELRLRECDAGQAVFHVREQVDTKNGEHMDQQLEMRLQLSDQGQPLLRQLRILPAINLAQML